MQRTDCHKFFYSNPFESQVEAISKDEIKIDAFEVPTVDDLLSTPSHTEPYDGVVSDDPDEAVIILHTSGSTGLPKPIYIRNSYLGSVDIYRTLKLPIKNRRGAHEVVFGHQSMFCMLPFFHTMGLFVLLHSVYCEGPMILPPAGQKPTADLALEIIRRTRPESGLFSPSLLEDVVETPGGLDALKLMDYALYGGAPLAKAAGDEICKVTHLQTVIGSTEGGFYPNLLSQAPEDWNYFEWMSGAGLDMEPQGEGLYELVIKRQKDTSLQPVFSTFPDTDEFHTQDLYEQHPTKPGLWRYSGRNDDIVVLSNGEKFNPVGFEKHVEGQHSVKGALVVGQGRFQAGMIIEPDWQRIEPDREASDILEEIWPAVESANAEALAHAHVWKSKIAFAKRDKPFIRTPKGSIMRRKNNELYAPEIDALYSHEAFDESLGKIQKQASVEDIKDYLREALKHTLPKVDDRLQDDTDLFSFGVDSLQTLGLASALSHAIPQDENGKNRTISPRLVYSNPTVDKLAIALHGIIIGDGGANAAKSTFSRSQRMDDIVHKFTKDLSTSRETPSERPNKDTVVLTGSTGSLGNYFLELLIADPKVEHIYCLNRSADAKQRQEKEFRGRGIGNPGFAEVTFLRAAFGEERFGLPAQPYEEMQRSATVFVHNAWAVDFNQDLSSFEPVHIAGTRRCIDFSISSKYRPHVFFVSSIASVGSFKAIGNTGEVPEEALEDNALPLPQGYGESKHVASRILAVAAKQCGVPVTVIRAGQLAGPAVKPGVWNKNEWLPSLVATSKALKKVPRTLGKQDTVDWVPMDDVAQIMLDLMHARTSDSNQPKLATFHLVNPKSSSWEDLAPTVAEHFSASVVSFQEWLEMLRATPVTQEEVASKPGLKLLDFYESLAASEGGLPGLATVRTAENSAAMRALKPVDARLMQRWLGQWSF